MIVSNPMPQGLLAQYQNKNAGQNPYQQQAAGLLAQILAQNNQAAHASLQRANDSQSSLMKMGMNNGMKDMFKKDINGNPIASQAQTASSKTTMETPTEDDQGQVIPAPRVGIDTVGRPLTGGTPATPPPGLSTMMPQLIASAQSAYPDNPTMQQVAVTQAIHESGLAGRPSDLATQNNNYFGIKASRSFPGTAGSVDYPTTEYVGGSPSKVNQGFAANNSMQDSFNQHANLMTGSDRYNPVLQAQNPLDAFGALQKAGYATDPNYADNLSSVWGKYVAPSFMSDFGGE